MNDIELPKVIGLCGRMYAGKTTIAEYLVKTYGYRRLAFGDALKNMLITAGMCTHDECYGKKTEQSRWLLQKVGTEIFRKQVHADYWVQRTAQEVIKILAAGDRVVLDDIRFPNEARLVKAYLNSGLLVKVERVNADGSGYRGGHGEANEHDSERGVDDIKADATITAFSGAIDFLTNSIKNSIIQWRRK